MITIDRCKDGDIPALEALLSAMGKQLDEGYFEFCLKEQQEGRREIYILRKDSADCGYGILNWTPRYGLYSRLGIAEVQDVNVIPEYRRQGIASAFIEYCEKAALDKGHEMIGISVGLTADFGAAQALYVKRGYIPDGNGVTYDRDPVSIGDTLVMNDNLCLMLIKELI